MLLEALKFVKGAVAAKDYQPVLTHFRIKDGRVTGYNGVIALSSPIDIDIEATPKAAKFVKAIEQCKSTTGVHLTPAKKLALKSGSFKAFIDCAEDSEILDRVVPEGNEIPLGTALLPAISALRPFIGTDASRPWSNGLLFRGHSVFATNNIIIAEYWLGVPVTEINLPEAAINELLRIKEEPTRVLMSANSITFFFNGDRWMRSQLLDLEWPNVEPFLNVEGSVSPIPDGFYDAIETLVPFVAEEGRIYFREGYVSTSPEDGAGAAIEFKGLPAYGAYNHKFLMSLKGVATHIDFTRHPQLCPFYGEKLRGVIQGMRDE